MDKETPSTNLNKINENDNPIDHGKMEEIEKSTIKENTTPIKGERIYLKEREGNVFFKEAKDEANSFYVLFNFNGNRAYYRFSGNKNRAIENYDAVLKDMFDDLKTYSEKATNIVNIGDGVVERGVDGRWKIITPAKIAYVIGDTISGIEALNDEIAERVNKKYMNKKEVIKNEKHAENKEEPKAIDVPNNAIFFGGKTNKELKEQTTNKDDAKFAIFNINGNNAEYVYIGKAINENWFEGVAEITNSVNDNLNNLKYIKTIEVGNVKKENEEWVITKSAKILFSNTETKKDTLQEYKKVEEKNEDRIEFDEKKIEDIEIERQEEIKRFKTQAGFQLDELNDYKISEFNGKEDLLIGKKLSETSSSYQGTSLLINNRISVSKIREMEKTLSKEEITKLLISKLKEFNEEMISHYNSIYDKKLAELKNKSQTNKSENEKTREGTMKITENNNVEKTEEKEIDTSWTEEDEKTLNNLLDLIESTKKIMEDATNQLKELKEQDMIKSENKKEEKTYSVDFIKEKMRELLSKIDSIKEIKQLEIKGINDTIEIKSEIRAKKGFMGVTVKLEAVLQNTKDSIDIKNYKIDAGMLTSFVESLVSPQLNKIKDLIKEYIEKEEGKKVEKIWIEEGELKVL